MVEIKQEQEQLRATTFNFEKFEELKKEFWKYSEKLKTASCSKHKTVFDPNEEPCWQCYDECEEEV